MCVTACPIENSEVVSDCIYYRPQRSCGQGNVFTGVCHSFCSQGGVHSGIPPQTRQTPPGLDPPTRQTPRTRQTPPWTRQIPPRNQADTPLDQADTPPRPGRHPPRTRQTPPQGSRLQHMDKSGRYASYWNAFLFWDFFFVSNCFRISFNGSESRNSVEGLTYKITGLKGGMPPSWIRYWKRAGVKKMKPTKISTLSIENETLNVFAWAWLKGVTWYKKYNAFWMFLCCVAMALFCFVNNHGIQTGSICVFPKVIWDWIQATISPVFCTEPTYYISTYFMHLSSYVIEIWNGSL